MCRCRQAMRGGCRPPRHRRSAACKHAASELGLAWLPVTYLARLPKGGGHLGSSWASCGLSSRTEQQAAPCRWTEEQVPPWKQSSQLKLLLQWGKALPSPIPPSQSSGGRWPPSSTGCGRRLYVRRRHSSSVPRARPKGRPWELPLQPPSSLAAFRW